MHPERRIRLSKFLSLICATGRTRWVSCWTRGGGYR